MSSIVIQKSQLVSLNVPVAQLGQQRFNFTDQPQLRSLLAGKNVLIDGIEVYNDEDVTHDQNGAAVITPAIMKKSFITLFISDPQSTTNMGEYINYMPFTSLHRAQAATTSPFVRDLVKFPGLTVDWSKCYVSLASPIAGATSYSFLFNIYYHFGTVTK